MRHWSGARGRLEVCCEECRDLGVTGHAIGRESQNHRQKFRAVRETPLGIDRQRPLDFDLERRCPGQLRRQRRHTQILAQQALGDGGGTLLLSQTPTGQCLPQHDPRAENVGAHADRLREQAFG